MVIDIIAALVLASLALGLVLSAFLILVIFLEGLSNNNPWAIFLWLIGIFALIALVIYVTGGSVVGGI